MTKEYIDRQSIYDRVKTHTNPYGKPTLDFESGVKVLNMIKTEFATDVAEVRHAKWELIGTEKFMGGGYISIFRCSLCGREVEFCHKNDSDKYEYANTLYPYCHCGAKMDGKVCDENETD